MDMRFTLAEIAAALGVTKRAVEKRAASESWPYTEEPVRGGKRRLYAPADLPAAIRRKVLAFQGVRAAKRAHQQVGRALPAVFVLVIDGETFEVRRVAA